MRPFRAGLLLLYSSGCLGYESIAYVTSCPNDAYFDVSSLNCVKCPAGQRPDEARTSCQCDGSQLGREEEDSPLSCIACPEGEAPTRDGLTCLPCSAGETILLSGNSSNPSAGAVEDGTVRHLGACAGVHLWTRPPVGVLVVKSSTQ